MIVTCFVMAILSAALPSYLVIVVVAWFAVAAFISRGEQFDDAIRKWNEVENEKRTKR